MPYCKNDPKKTYKGNEPSPKGLGYCAHSEDIGTIKNGLDGNKWIIYKTSEGIKRWVKINNEKKNKEKIINHHKILLTENNEQYIEIKKKYSGYKTYFTHYNNNRPYLLYVKNKDVIIYNIPEDKIDYSLYNNEENKNKWMYINLVEKYKVKEIFIGKSPLISMTKFSNGHGKYFDGNTILLLLNDNNYVYISSCIDIIKINDKIEKYYSFVGNNDVPYPMALSNKNIYFFNYPKGFLPIDEFPKIKSNKNLQKIFDKGIELSPFLINFDNKKNNSKISLEEFKKIKNKKLDDISLDQMKKLANIYSVTVSGTKKELANRIEKLRGVIVYKK